MRYIRYILIISGTDLRMDNFYESFGYGTIPMNADILIM